MTNKHHFQRVILYARQHRANQEVSESLQRIIACLTNKGLSIYQDTDTATSFNFSIPVLERQHMGEKKT